MCNTMSKGIDYEWQFSIESISKWSKHLDSRLSQFKATTNFPKILYFAAEKSRIYRLAFVSACRKTGTSEEKVLSLSYYKFPNKHDEYVQIENETGVHYKGELYQ